MKKALVALSFLFVGSSALANAPVVECVRQLKVYQSFNNDQAAKACSGAKDSSVVVECVRQLKLYHSFNNDQAALACKQYPDFN